ncbi:hypothetical protein ACHAWF_005150 [Thalassiosira exigua]
MEEEYEEDRLLFEEEQRQKRREQRQQQSWYADDGSSLYEKIRNGASHLQAWKDTLDLDPWAVFEDFFFQDSTSDDAENNNVQNHARNPNSDHYQSNYEGRHKQVPRVFETTIYRGFDPGFGADVYTVLRREEHISDESGDGECYYRIFGQDFISGTRVDPFTGFLMQKYYSAVTEPYFVEEGRSKQYHAREEDDGNYRFKDHYHGQQTTSSAQIQRASPSKLTEGESVTPNSTSKDPWISPNGNYEAILTTTCELKIVSRDENSRNGQSVHDIDDGDRVVWSSETYIPNTRASGCHLALNSMGRLVLSVDYGSGLKSLGNTVLWNTPLPPVVPHWFREESGNQKHQSVTFWYYASLDNDGVIAVYRVGEQIGNGADKGSTQKQNKPSTAGPDRSSSTPPTNSSKYSQMKQQIRPIIDKLGTAQSKAALAWKHLRYSVGQLFLGRPWIAATASEGSRENSLNRHECIYSTSPAGCLAPGRNAIHITKVIARSLKRSVKSIDSHLDNFLTSLIEPASDYDYDGSSYGDYSTNYPAFDEDEDILDTLLRVTEAAGAAGAHLGKAGIHAAQLGMKRGRKVAGKMVGKMKDKMGKHSIQWGERMADDEEVGRFF